MYPAVPLVAISTWGPLTRPLGVSPSLCDRIWTPEFKAAIDFDIERQFEVSIELVSTQERIGASLGGLTNNRFAFDAVRGGAIALRPTIQVLAIEEVRPSEIRTEDR